MKLLLLKLAVKLVGETDKDALETMAKVGTQYELTHGATSYGNYTVHSFTWDQEMSICQTFRPDLAEDSPVFVGELELYE